MSHSYHLIKSLPSYHPVWVGFAASFLACLAIFWTSKHHREWSGDDDTRIQKSHEQNFVPRIGGLAIFFAMILLYVFLEPGRQAIFGPIVLASFPIFFVGFSEDILRNVTPFHRLLVAFICGVFGWWITGFHLTHIGIHWIDSFLSSHLVISVAFTAFAITGFTHAHNMIDGVNGLSSGLALMFAMGVALIAYQVDDYDLWYASIAFVAIILGFFIVNFPWGKLFLGDAGAYLCGFVVAWLGIVLTVRQTTVSEFAPFLLGIHPICEAVFSIVRRRLSHRLAMQPDAEHFHMLIKRKVLRPKFPGLSTLFYNSLAGFVILLMNIPCLLVAIYFYDSLLALLTGIALYVLMFVVVSKYLEPDIFKNPAQR